MGSTDSQFKSKLKDFWGPNFLPGVSELREVVAKRAWPKLPKMVEIRKNGVAGLTIAITELPDGMANGILAGVNPLYGLYANMVGPLVGGFFSSTQLLTVVTTSAATLTVGQSIAALPPEARANALFLTVIISGLFQVAFGLLGAGRLVRFVSYSVMTGFLAGIGFLLMLSQLPTVTGYAATGANKIVQTINLAINIESIDIPSVLVALLTLFLIVMLPRTRIGRFSTLIGVAVPSLIAAIFQLDSVDIVRDVGQISGGIPLPHLPSFSEAISVVPAALALAAVVLIQGAGVSQSVPNPDGSPTRVSRDFVAQGAANIASGFFRGLSVGGSLSATTLTVVAGASRRSAVIFAGLWLMTIVAAFPKLVGSIAMPSLGALLIVVGFRSVMRSEVRSILGAGWSSVAAAITTFLATLLLPIEMAVALGVLVSCVHYLVRSSMEVSIVELVELSDGRLEERAPPSELEGNRVVVFNIYGHLFYAGARTLEAKLPQPGKGKNPAVVLRLRGRKEIGATLIDVLSAYARMLKEVDGKLYISGVEPAALNQLRRSRKLQINGPVQIFAKTPILGESTSEAKSHAETWLVE